jgi:hypothetical protein
MQKIDFNNLELFGLDKKDISLIKKRKIKKIDLYKLILHNSYFSSIDTINLFRRIEHTSLFKLISKDFVFKNITLSKTELLYIAFKKIAPALYDLKKEFKKHKLIFKIATYQDPPLSLAIDIYSKDIKFKSISKEPFLSRFNFDLFLNKNLKTSIILGNYQTADPLQVEAFCKKNKIKYFSNFVYSLFMDNFKNKSKLFLNPNYFESLKHSSFEYMWEHKYKFSYELKDKSILLGKPIEQIYAEEYKKDLASIEKRVKGMHKSIANKFGFKRSEKKKYWPMKKNRPK